MFKSKKIRYVDLKEINEHLAYCYKYRNFVYAKKSFFESFENNAFIEDKMVEFRLEYKRGTDACLYIFKKDGSSGTQKINGAEAFRILSKYYKVPRVDAPGTARPFLWLNKKYEGKRVNAYCYDLNSAYSFAMLKPMPDTSVPPRKGKIGKNEIGFMELPIDNDLNEVSLQPIFSGNSDYIFPLIESPFKHFVEVWYKKKQNPDDKVKAKGVLNYSVGYLQKINPFLRATIIGYCNNLIKSLKDDNTLYCNTDSIVSLVERPDLKLGSGIGEWKLEHKGLFAYKGFNYQWNYEPPAYRGMPKKWFKKNWDLLKDELPIFGNIYEFNGKKIVKVKKGENYGKYRIME